MCSVFIIHVINYCNIIIIHVPNGRLKMYIILNGRRVLKLFIGDEYMLTRTIREFPYP